MRIISRHELAPIKGIAFSNPHLLDLEQQGKFPKRVRLGERRYGWFEHEIDAWLEDRAALRDKQPSPPVDGAQPRCERCSRPLVRVGISGGKAQKFCSAECRAAVRSERRQRAHSPSQLVTRP